MLLLAAMACAVAACSEDEKRDEIITSEDDFLTVELSFTPYTVEPVTRAVTGIADVVTRLDVWLYENGSNAASSSEPFSFLCDLDQAATSAWADWFNNYKPTIESDHTRAEQHSVAMATSS